MTMLVVTGTGTGVGKTVVTAAIAALAAADGRRVAVVKPVQTGVLTDEPGDLAEIARLSGVSSCHELARYPDPLAPATAARLSERPSIPLPYIVHTAAELTLTHDLVLIEVDAVKIDRLSDDGGTLADVAVALDAPVLVVAAAGLGTLNATALTAEALRTRGLRCVGVVVGSWPPEPDLASRCNLVDLPSYAGAPLLGVLPGGAARLSRAEFLELARQWLVPALGGSFGVSQLSALRPMGAAH